MRLQDLTEVFSRDFFFIVSKIDRTDEFKQSSQNIGVDGNHRINAWAAGLFVKRHYFSRACRPVKKPIRVLQFKPRVDELQGARRFDIFKERSLKIIWPASGDFDIFDFSPVNIDKRK